MTYTNAYHDHSGKAVGRFMKATGKSLMVLAVSSVVCEAAQAQNNGALIHEGVATNPPAHLTLETNAAPALTWGSRTQVSGLFVDLIRPRQTWVMLKPSGPARDQSTPIPPYWLPVSAPLSMNDNLAVHEPGIVLFHFGF